MLPIPSALQAQFEEHLGKRAIEKALHGVYTKWLRYYLDFCQKYSSPPSQGRSLPQFIHKLQEKKQTKAQRRERSKRPNGAAP